MERTDGTSAHTTRSSRRKHGVTAIEHAELNLTEPTPPSGQTTDPDYFREAYKRKGDPWNYGTSDYELGKYATTLQALPRHRYARALELGCSIGIFTAALARRCDSLLAVDVAESALVHARQRCADLPTVRFLELDLSLGFPSGSFDLVTLCETGYYFSPELNRRIHVSIAQSLEPGGHLILVHYINGVPHEATPTVEVHERYLKSPCFAHIHGADHPGFRLDLFSRTNSQRFEPEWA